MSNPPPFTGNVQDWAEDLSDFLSRQETLPFIDSTTASATVDGVLALDPNIPGVYVSWNGGWTQVVAL